MLSCTTLSHHALTITNNKLGNNAKKGDIILVPKGTPHWFKEIGGTFLYYVVQMPRTKQVL